jgi:prophage tail gpP-like protein
MPNAVLTIGGMEYGGWTRVRVARSLDAVSGTFSLALTDRWPGQDVARPVRPGESCTLRLDGDVVITGYVDDVSPSYDATSHLVTVSGRDATGDLVDCSASNSPGEWHNRSMEYIASAISKPFGVAVSVNVPSDPFKRFRLEESETAFEAIERMARMRAVLATSDVNGNLLITRSGKGGRAAVALVQGKNILKASAQFSLKDRFSRYTVKGQQPLEEPSTAAHVKGTALDSAVTRYRPLTLIAEDATDASAAATRAEWEKVYRRAKGNSVSVTVQGWREVPGGALWMPNRLVRVSSPWLGVDTDLLITAVALSLDESGTVTELSLMPQEAFDMRPEKEKDVSEWN